MSYYSYQISTLNNEIRSIRNAIDVYQEHRQELLDARNQLETEKSTIESDKSQIQEPEIGNDTARGTIASDFEREERDMLEKEHNDLPDQVQEMIEAIESERDRLQGDIDSSKGQILYRQARVKHFRNLDKLAKKNKED